MKISTCYPLIALLMAGCGGTKSPKPSSHSKPPATVMQISNEMQLASVTLTEQAERRLGISTAAVKRQPVETRRPYPGIVVVPPQNLTMLMAPMAGTLRYAGSPAVGASVRQGEPIFSVVPMLVENYALGPTQEMGLKSTRLTLKQNEDAILTRINNAKVEVEASLIDLKRAEQLFKEQVGSRKRVDDAKARAQLGQEVLDSANRELATVRQITRQDTTPTASPMTQAAPMSGTISKIQVASGQAVSAGQPVLELSNLQHLWLRVRIPQAEAAEIQREETARVGSTEAVPVRGAPTGDQLTSSLDLYYAVENGRLNPDQRVEVSLPLKGSQQQLLVPTASILYDIHGGSWVYLRKKPQQFERARVQVEFSTEGGQSVLTQGPKVGSTVVVHGAAELFGIEFGND
ncbi:hypothetical protein ABS71_20375 [bacterium SCN 62-11]|nr:MAG: hypothetical protein ABS71_20375 [bacterium SCN 62-11]